MLPGADRAVQAEAGNGVPVADTVPCGCGCGPAGSRSPASASFDAVALEGCEHLPSHKPQRPG